MKKEFSQKEAIKKVIDYFQNQFIDPFKKLRDREINYYQKKALEDLMAGRIMVVASSKKQHKDKIEIMKLGKRWNKSNP